MARTLLLVPTRQGVGMTSTSLGLTRAFERLGQQVAFVKPVRQWRPDAEVPDRTRALIELTTTLKPPVPISLERAAQALASGQEQTLLEEVVGKVAEAAAGAGQQSSAQVLIVEGLVPTEDVPFAEQLNELMANALDAETVLLGTPVGQDPTETAQEFVVAARAYGTRVVGCVLNQVAESDAERIPSSSRLLAEAAPTHSAFAQAVAQYKAAFALANLRLVGAVPQRPELSALRVLDIARGVNAETMFEGDLSRRVLQISVAAKAVPGVLRAFKTGSLVIVPSDRNDVLMAAALSTLSGVALAGILMTGQDEPNMDVVDLCKRAVDAGVSLLRLPESTLPAAIKVLGVDKDVPVDDKVRAELVMNTVADSLDEDWIRESMLADRPHRLSPPAFRHLLVQRARAAQKRIVFPEGDEPRTIAAAVACQERGIARCVLLGDPKRIAHVAADNGVSLPSDLQIVEPASVFEQYVDPMYELRKHKGVTRDSICNQLQDRVLLGTMMLAQGDVDGLVSGAVHTTADTVRPALQLLKIAPGTSLVSSIFFMCLPEEVLVYGDCAINPDPTAEQLAEIAIQSADSAERFGIQARVAMISYSTGTSGAGRDVEKVAEATRIAQRRRPDLIIDGPLQYDAAVMPSVAESKAPHSDVAGRATVLIFPDLNTGNTTYKAVQRSAHVVSIGPMLQGLARPVNDLSRGCLVDDIIYTVALTAIQATANEGHDAPPSPEAGQRRETLPSSK